MKSGERPDTQLSIGELARCAGVTSRTVRHYHATGLLPEPPRDASGYRRYGPGDLSRLLHVCRLRALGMPIDQIEKVLEPSSDEGGDLHAALRALAVDVDAEIDRLHGVHDRLISLASSDDLHGAAELLSADLRARGLLDLNDPDDPTANAHLDPLLQRFCLVADGEVEQLAQELASLLPTPRHPELSVDLPMVDRLIGDRLSQPQRDCMLRLQALLQARTPPVGSRAPARL